MFSTDCQSEYDNFEQPGLNTLFKFLAIANGTVAVNGLPAESSWPPAEGQECVVAGCGL